MKCDGWFFEINTLNESIFLSLVQNEHKDFFFGGGNMNFLNMTLFLFSI